MADGDPLRSGVLLGPPGAGKGTQAGRIVAEAYEAEDEAATILDRAEQAIFAIAEDQVRPGFVSMRQLAHGSFEAIEQAHERKQLITGVPTGFERIDRVTSRSGSQRRVSCSRDPPSDSTRPCRPISVRSGVGSRSRFAWSIPSACPVRRSSSSIPTSGRSTRQAPMESNE